MRNVLAGEFGEFQAQKCVGGKGIGPEPQTSPQNIRIPVQVLRIDWLL